MLKSQTLIHHFIETNAVIRPDKTALIHETVRATYFQLNNWANQLARHLLASGITRGDRVVIFLDNGLEFLISYFGVLKAGAVAVPLATQVQPGRLSLLLSDLEPAAIITTSQHEHIFLDLIHDTTLPGFKSVIIQKPSIAFGHVPFAITAWDDIINAGEAENPVTLLDPSDLAAIIYTSGSTTVPKGVMLSHHNCVSNTHAIIQALGITETDIQMCVLPCHYVMGMSVVNTHLAAGGTVVINNGFAFTGQVIEQMVRERVTAFSGVPSNYACLLKRSPLLKYRDRLDSLRYCSQAGGHMSRLMKEELLQVLPPHTRLYVMYGATEASARLTVLDPDSLRTRIESIGRPIAGVTLRVLDENCRELPPGETGELVASGPNIMQGYWKDPVHSAEVLDANGYHTGDLGYRDSEGYYFIVGRKNSLLKVAGHRINPREIEETLMGTGLLNEVAVIGVPDPLLGQRMVVIASPAEKMCTEQEVLKSCFQLLPRFKLPSEVRLIEALPKTSNAKIDYVRCAGICEQQQTAVTASPIYPDNEDCAGEEDIKEVFGTEQSSTGPVNIPPAAP